MFKKLVALVVLSVSVGLGANFTLAAAQYEEGTHYVVRGSKLTPTKEIREFFSFWCGHCFAMQGAFHQIRAAIPEAKFVPNPVMMLGGPMGAESQKALAVADNMGLADEFIQRLFHDMHELGQIPMTHDEMSSFMTTVGISKGKYDSEYNSFPILGKVAQYDKAADDAEIDAVPELLVNGKYLVIMESVNNDQELTELVRYLVHLDDVPNAAPAAATKAVAPAKAK